EALAYPLFLLGVAAIVRGVADGTRTLRIVVPIVCVLAVTARLQLVVLPLAYFAAVVLCSPRRRAHLVPLAALGVPGLAAVVLRGSGAIGQYDGVLHLSLTPGGTMYYDAPTATSFASLSGRFGQPNATLIVELLALAVGIGVAAAHPRRAVLATATALAGIALSAAGGVAYYRADHATTDWV